MELIKSWINNTEEGLQVSCTPSDVSSEAILKKKRSYAPIYCNGIAKILDRSRIKQGRKPLLR